MCRLGLGLYGFGYRHNGMLRPVSTLRTRIVQVKHLTVGDAVGYGRAGKLTRATTTATIPIGYADGLDRHLGCGRWSVLVAGSPAPIVGRICGDSRREGRRRSRGLLARAGQRPGNDGPRARYDSL